MKTDLTGIARGRALLIVLVAVVFGIVGAVFARTWLSGTATLQAASMFPTPREITAFELDDAAGGSFTRADLDGGWTLMFFGFSNCPDICPDTLSQLAIALERLEQMRVDPLPRVVFVSVDPERDRGEELAEYAAWFHPGIRAVTADEDRLQEFTRQLSVVYYREAADPETGHYNVDHSGMVVIIDPQGRMAGRFSQPIDTDHLVADLFRLTS